MPATAFGKSPSAKSIFVSMLTTAALVGCGATTEPGAMGEMGEMGEMGQMGDPGLSCWDLNANDTCDVATEDQNSDGVCDALDCRGADGSGGLWTAGSESISYGGNVGVGTVGGDSTLAVQGTLSRQLSGIVSTTFASTTVSGSGTAFQDELAVGDAIGIDGEVYTVVSIASQTSLELDVAPTSGVTDSTAFADGDLMSVANAAGDARLSVDPSGAMTLQTGSDTPTTLSSQGDVFQIHRGNTLALSVDAAGKIGIGRTSPLGTLHIDTSAHRMIRFTRSSGAGTQELLMDASASTANQEINLERQIGDNLRIRSLFTVYDILGSSAKRLRLGTNGRADDLVIGANSNVGVGTESPAAKLEVASGDVYISNPTSGLILRSPNGAICSRVGIDNAGSFTLQNITCP